MCLLDDDPLASGAKTLAGMIALLRDDYPDMDLTQLLLFLHIVACPGTTARDLLARMSISKSTLSRNIRLLADVSYRADAEGRNLPGWGLIFQTPSAADERCLLLFPTEAGLQIAKKLTGHFEGNG